MKTVFAAIQWVAFMLASSIVAPIAIADLFGLTGEDAANFVQRTVFIFALAGLLQIFFGHKLPINEAPAGLWWGVFTIYAGFSTTLFSSAGETLQALQGALIASGLLFILLSMAGLIDKISKMFTPAVIGIYLLLLVIQLSKSFLNGMLGVGYVSEKVDLKIAALSFVTVLLTFYFTRHKLSIVRQYAVLISLAVGWILFAVFGAIKPNTYTPVQIFNMPQIFVYGRPTFDSGMIITAVFVTLLLLTNLIASIRVVELAVQSIIKKEAKTNLRASGYITGISQMLGGVFSAVGPVPLSGASGFIATSKVAAKLPFIIGSLLLILSSFMPSVMNFLASIPVPVGYSVMFVVFTSMIGMAFLEIEKEEESNRVRTVVGISLLGGVGVMFVPASAFTGLPPIVVSLLNNGLIFGSILSIITDQWTKFIYKRKQY
ncbi:MULTISPECIES: purine/pyrimidine permease [Bacillaceae]|uniref:Xanthine/uracil permease n=1 Tax=Peribacillus huizhouensis TaxID=1501239 RepID=A0ABR6CVQ3_9BACI|nr:MULTISPECIES: purine/pyrimidine permease [Bacillaceae]MBA9029108.1 xanthine/uracil permease [Peribacillus huizhouensis]